MAVVETLSIRAVIAAKVAKTYVSKASSAQSFRVLISARRRTYRKSIFVPRLPLGTRIDLRKSQLAAFLRKNHGVFVAFVGGELVSELFILHFVAVRKCRNNIGHPLRC